ncbi:coiled-coil domain-containing protein [Syntrophaceticus schinkii]|jgi:hypothetical protein|uniref:Methyl-accepting chemotaxis protein n=1 Tax=Syntrophaceticus schinkii TaxID=499207 RepID=A0A0B7MBM7_9FIRM|nr:hypothetical protein [Syntrophaceticus schinkii]CEO87914.1 Methyl-accepting chemotaxis protein [Syntrophaceticus schinkii]
MFDSIEQLEKQVQKFQENILASNQLLAGIEALTLAVKNQQRGYEQASASLIEEIKGHVKAVTDESETLRAGVSSEVQMVTRSTQDATASVMKSNVSLSDSVASKSEALREALAADVKSVLQGTQDAVAEMKTNNYRVIEEVSNKSETLRGALSYDINGVLQETKTAVTEIKANNEATLKAAVEQLSLKISKLNTDTERFIAELKSADESAIDSAVQKLTASQQSNIKQLEAAQSAIEEMNRTLNTKYQEFLQRLENTNFDQLFKTCQDMKKSIETKLYLLMGGVGIAAIIAVLSLLIR